MLTFHCNIHFRGTLSALCLAILAGCNQSAERAPDNSAESPAPPQVAAVKPSFDCAKASKPQEKLICSDNELAELDAKLAEAYSKATQSGDKTVVLQAQRQWIRQSFNSCSDKDCLLTAYRDRIAQLQVPPSKNDSQGTPAARRAELARRLGVDGWARCSAGQIAIDSLAERGDPIPPEFVNGNKSLGASLLEVRDYFISNGKSWGEINSAFEKAGHRITSKQISGEDMVKEVVECANEFNRIK